MQVAGGEAAAVGQDYRHRLRQRPQRAHGHAARAEVGAEHGVRVVAGARHDRVDLRAEGAVEFGRGAGRPGRLDGVSGRPGLDGPIEAGTPADAVQAAGPAGAPPELDRALRAEIDAIVAGASHDPHAVLGAHLGPGGVTVRALRPLAETVTIVLPDGRRFPASHLHEGVFAATLPVTGVPDYRIAVTYPGSAGPGGAGTVTDDPY